MSFWKRGQRGARAYYYVWQLGAYFVGRKLHWRVKFDLVHHVTFGSYWMPSFLALLPVPFVWGPVGGGESAPRAFWSRFSFRGKVYEILRDLARDVARLDPFVRLTARHATLGLATTEETRIRMQALGCRNVVLVSSVGLAFEDVRRLQALPVRHGIPFRVLSIGRLLHWKGFDLGLEAFARFHMNFPDSEYWLIGDGPERQRLEKLAHDLDVAQKVTFWGELPRSSALERLAGCDVLLHPSLHDSGGWVCIEAMGAGRPVICLDLGGPALQVDQASGIKISAGSPEQVVSDMAKALGQLAEDAGRRLRLGQGARTRAQGFFSWDSKGTLLSELYDRARSDQRPRGNVVPISVKSFE